MSETSEVIIRDMEKGEEFAEWFADLLQRHDDETGLDVHRDDRYLVLSNEIGDWIGGLRYSLQGGVAHLLELAIAPDERHQGHAHRLLEAFEIPLLAGRRFDGRERAGGAPVMLVNRVFVTTHMGLDNADPSALSQALERIVQMPAGEEMAQFRIIGVVGDTRQHGPEHAPPAMVFAMNANCGLCTVIGAPQSRSFRARASVSRSCPA